MKAIKKLIGSLALLSVFLGLPAFGQNRTSFAGMRNAISFAYGGPVGNGVPAPLAVGGTTLVNAGTNVTLIVAFGNVVLADGTQFMPFATTAPVTIGIAGAQETVTPSAVSCLTPTVYNSCSITVTTSFAHGINDPISSGTFGLQEAINFGPGTAIIDSTWGLYGTQAMVAAANLGTAGNSAILDNRNGAGVVQTYTTTITNAQILALFTTPIQLLPAPGAGNAWDVLDMWVENKNAGVAYASGAALQASYGTGVTNPATATIATAFLTSPTAPQSVKVAGAAASALTSAYANQAINFTNATQNFTTGTGTLIVKISARLITGL